MRMVGMDKNRTREALSEALMNLGKVANNDYDISRDFLFLEILLDIRDELSQQGKKQGEVKWASKL